MNISWCIILQKRLLGGVSAHLFPMVNLCYKCFCPTVTLKSPSSQTFSGFLVQARSSGSTNPLGTFGTASGTRQLTCGSAVSNVHKNSLSLNTNSSGILQTFAACNDSLLSSKNILLFWSVHNCTETFLKTRSTASRRTKNFFEGLALPWLWRLRKSFTDGGWVW